MPERNRGSGIARVIGVVPSKIRAASRRRIRQRNRIGMGGGDDIDAGSDVLPLANAGGEAAAE